MDRDVKRIIKVLDIHPDDTVFIPKLEKCLGAVNPALCWKKKNDEEAHQMLDTQEKGLKILLNWIKTKNATWKNWLRFWKELKKKLGHIK